MKRSKYISFLLAMVMLASCFVFPMSAEAEADLSSLNNIQKYYLRTVGSLARADYYENDILASVTLSQAIYEAGWAMYSLPIGGNNLFGIKAYSTWDGMVYDQRESMLYASYEDFLLAKGQSHLNTVSAWRAHESWAESVAAHSSLFLTESKYAAVIGETDYKKTANAIVAAGYCSDNGYADRVVGFIEDYGLDAYDDITPDPDGIVALTADKERVRLDIGDTFTVSLNYYPSDKTPSAITWKSDNPDVATVNKNGKVTAVAHGTTLISATLANGREACCIVYVDCNATVKDSDVYVRVSASSSADNNGKFSRGAAVKVTSDTIYTDSEGNEFYKVTGYNTKGNLVSGYAAAEYIYRNVRDVSDISVVKNDITLKSGDKYTVRAVVSPADAVDTTLTWTSSDTSVATVDKNGVITAKANGTAVITAAASGGVTEKITVNVADATKKYVGIVSASTSNVRKEPSDDSAKVGSFAFLTEITVIGEPVGAWYKVSGKNSSGTTITGYVYAPYVRIVEEGFDVTYAAASGNIAVYGDMSTSSVQYGTLKEGETYAVISGSVNGWSLVVGKKTSGSAIYGYARITVSEDSENGNTSNPGTDTDINASAGWYGRTTADLNVRSGAGTGYAVISRFDSNTQVTISGENDGWYTVSGTDTNGESVSGYSSADYITTLYSGVTTSNLNVRKEPTTASDSLGTLSNGTEVTIVGEIDSNGWYYVESTDSDGNLVAGYCFGEYITVLGKLPAEITVGGFTILDPNLDISGGVLCGVSAKTTASALKEAFKGEVTVLDASGKKTADGKYVGTGCTVRSEESGNSITVLIKGDADGDGDITEFDYIYVKRHFFETYTLKGVYLEAAMVSGEDTIGVFDYVMIKRVVFGTYSF